MVRVFTRVVTVVLFGGLVGAGSSPLLAQAVPIQTAPAQSTPAPSTQAPPAQVPSSQPAPPPTDSAAPDSDLDARPPEMPALPPPPSGKSTILGGEIKSVDPVRDVLTLKIVGTKPVKILFDQRTQVFLDGKHIALPDLKAADHAAVQTVLDGTDIYALSVHMLSHSPEGDYQGTVLNYNAATTELTVTSDISHAPMLLLVPAGTPVVRQGQASFRAGQHGLSDLVRGTLITVKFASNLTGGAVASSISILAIPGAEFTFIGNISQLDLHSGKLTLSDPRDNRTYQLGFDPGSLRAAQSLRIGQHVLIAAVFDGAKYFVRTITPD